MKKEFKDLIDYIEVLQKKLEELKKKTYEDGFTIDRIKLLKLLSKCNSGHSCNCDGNTKLICNAYKLTYGEDFDKIKEKFRSLKWNLENLSRKMEEKTDDIKKLKKAIEDVVK